MIFTTFETVSGEKVFATHQNVETAKKAVKKNEKIYKNLKIWQAVDGAVKIHDPVPKDLERQEIG